MDKAALETSLGFYIKDKKTVWELDLTHLRVFKGLSVLSGILGELILEKADTSQGDVSLLYKINPGINPELVEMRIYYIQIYSRSGVLNEATFMKEEFHNQLRTVFGTFQRPSWGKLIHPEFYGEDPILNPSIALLFPFHYTSSKKQIDYQFILERAESGIAKGEYFLRLTIENHYKESLNLQSLSYKLVDDLKERTYIAGSTRISETLNDRIQTACSRGLTEYSEDYRHYSIFFEQLEKTSLGKIDSVNFYWSKKFISVILNEQPSNNVRFIKKLLLVIEDSLICSGLKKGKEIKLKIGSVYVVLYLSHLNRVLNFSIQLPRKKYLPDIYLDRMSELKELSISKEHGLSFRNINIFLIHHITSEIIALIQAFRNLGCTSMSVGFVKYAGMVPSHYLNTLLDLPQEEIFMLGLIRKLTETEQEYYSLAEYYSDTLDYQNLKLYLEQNHLKYMEAMKLLVGNMFLKYCLKAKQENKPVLLVEDGGYLAPFFNEFALENQTVSQVFQKYLLESDDNSNFSDWLKGILIGSIEHTRNGYNRLLNTQEKFGKLFLPAYSIAISNSKTIIESKEVAHSILSAIESILHSQGFILSSKNIMVLGSAGNIGRFLLDYLKNGRLEIPNTNLIGIDIAYSAINQSEYRYISEVPNEILYNTELFIGVIGESILNKNTLEDILLNGNKQNLFFASGSTKNLEFLELSNWIESAMKQSMILDIPAEFEYSRISDPQTGLEMGGKLRIQIKHSKPISKTLFLLGDLTPINFLYYGVPTETMDIIISQLTRVSLGMVGQFQSNSLPPPGLYAVDHSIDMWGNQI